MRHIAFCVFGIVVLAAISAGIVFSGDSKSGLTEQRQAILKQIQETHQYSDDQLSDLKKIFESSDMMGQGNPAVTQHPFTPQECKDKLQKDHIEYENPAFEKICGGKYMAPLYNPATQKPEDAKACVDQFEFPDIPCAYPVIWVRAVEAEEICEALGKRMCDAHEWEGACAGSLLDPDYHFIPGAKNNPEPAIRSMRASHNREFEPSKTWSYGPTYRTGVCAGSSHKNAGCNGGSWTQCGSNTFPAGFFPDCHSTLGVYDLNGNAAEHMNLPLDESQMTSRGSKTLGHTEMKGSWFIFDAYHAHEDWCRWRAPYWHGTRVMDPDSHRNYHLGFRCCKTIEKK
jgi:hypothetical protein